jgi:hypothetical protein
MMGIVFAVLMEATKYCSLGQLTAAMFEVGGQYRRNMKAQVTLSEVEVRACPSPQFGGVRLSGTSPHSVTPALSRGSSLAGFPLRSVTRNQRRPIVSLLSLVTYVV